MLIAPQPVADEQKTNHLRSKIYIFFNDHTGNAISRMSKMVFLLKVKNINLAIQILIWKTLVQNYFYNFEKSICILTSDWPRN